MTDDPLADVAAVVHDVVVVGAGPSGSSCAYWLANAGWDVVVIEKKTLPREKTCGDGLTPSAVRQLADMGLEHADRRAGPPLRRAARRRLRPGDRDVLARAPHFPAYGYTITRFDLDALVADHAASRGATVRYGAEAVAPLEGMPPAARGRLGAAAGVTVRRHGDRPTADVRARYVVVADGANSRLGRALGAARRRDWPMGMALRGLLDVAAARRRVHREPHRHPRRERWRSCPATAGSSRSATAG